MNDTTSYREKGRAVFLAAIMVLSVVAMSAAFAGSAAASSNYDPDNPWQGQTVTVDVPSEDEYDLRLVTESDSDGIQSSEFVREISSSEAAGGNDVVNVSTTNLDAGEYFVADSEAGEDETFEVRVQDLDVEFDNTEVTDDGPGATTEVDIDSNRGTYYLNASADGDLDDEELFAIFTTDDTDVDADASEMDFLDSGITGTVSMEYVIANDDDISDRMDFAAEYRAENEGSLLDHGEQDTYANPDVTTFGDFNVALYNDDQDGEDLDYDEKVALLTSGDIDEGEVNFEGIDDDEYTFDFDATDTAASDSVDVTVSEADATADFTEGVYTQSAGDVVFVTVELEDTNDAFVQFGSADDGYLDIFYIADDEDNDEVSFALNTRLMGTGNPGAVVSGDDDVESLVDGAQGAAHDGFDNLRLYDDEDDVGGAATYDASQFDEYLEDLELIDDAGTEDGTDQLVRPLQATDYPLATFDGDVYISDDDESEVDNELDAATLDLTTPELGSISTHVAPEGSADEHELEELLGDEDAAASITERTDVALDDRLIVHAEASGIYGALLALEGDGFDPLDDGFEPGTIDALNNQDGEGVTIEIEGDATTGNQDPNYVDFENADEDDVLTYVNVHTGDMYIVVDTSSSSAWDRSVEDGDTFTATIEYETDDDERFYFTDSGTPAWGGGAGEDPGEPDDADAAFPYFGADSTESVSTSFDLVDREVAFDNVDADDNVQIETSDEAVLTGETNVAPGSSVDIRVTNAGDTPSFISTEDAEIASDGTFESDAFEFGDRGVDDEANIDFRVSGSTVDEVDGIFVEAVEETDDEEPEEDDEPPETDDDEPPETDDDEPAPSDDDAPAPSDDDEPVDTEDDGVPGFGLAIAVVALLAAAMLALRRQN